MADAQHLPQGRHQAGDRHLNFHETRDNLLDDAEQQLLGLVMDRRSNNEIAAAIHLAESTVKYHLNGLMTKFQVRNRIKLAVRASELGYH